MPPTAAAMMVVVLGFDWAPADEEGMGAGSVVGGDGWAIKGEDGGRMVRMSGSAVGPQLRCEMEKVELE